MRVHGRVQAVYTAVCVYGPCRCRVHGPAAYTAMYTVVSRVHATYTAVIRPCTCRVHGRIRAMNTAVYKPCTRSRPCTSRVHGRVHVNTTRVHSRVCDRVQVVYTALYTDRVQVFTARSPFTAVTAVNGHERVRVHCREHVCIHGRVR